MPIRIGELNGCSSQFQTVLLDFIAYEIVFLTEKVLIRKNNRLNIQLKFGYQGDNPGHNFQSVCIVDISGKYRHIYIAVLACFSFGMGTKDKGLVNMADTFNFIQIHPKFIDYFSFDFSNLNNSSVRFKKVKLLSFRIKSVSFSFVMQRTGGLHIILGNIQPICHFFRNLHPQNTPETRGILRQTRFKTRQSSCLLGRKSYKAYALSHFFVNLAVWERIVKRRQRSYDGQWVI